MAKKEKYTVEQVISEIKANKGLLSLVAQKLGCTYHTVYNYAQRYPTVAKAIDEAKESMLDLAEGNLFKEISKGNMTAIIFYLKTQGKRRRYSERLELTGSDGEPIKHQEVKELTDDQLTNIASNGSRRITEAKESP